VTISRLRAKAIHLPQDAPQEESVNYTHKSAQLANLHGALIDIVGVMNRPQGDQAIIDEAGIALDRALFPLLVIIDRCGPIGVVDLAGRVGRDYTTVSRQMAKLEQLGLAERRAGADRRVREAIVTPAGKAMNDAIDIARERLAALVFASWPTKDLSHLTRLLRRFADALILSKEIDSFRL
jgi:DNA-binding MarR family transcriptional regulator